MSEAGWYRILLPGAVRQLHRTSPRSIHPVPGVPGAQHGLCAREVPRHPSRRPGLSRGDIAVSTPHAQGQRAARGVDSLHIDDLVLSSDQAKRNTGPRPKRGKK